MGLNLPNLTYTHKGGTATPSPFQFIEPSNGFSINLALADGSIGLITQPPAPLQISASCVLCLHLCPRLQPTPERSTRGG